MRCGPGMRKSPVYVALLRGINVGGNNIVSMKALKDSFERLRFADVRTYINSGNVLFRSDERDSRKIEDRIDRMLARDYGLKGRTVVRTDSEMASLVRVIDKEWRPDPEWRWNVIFVRHTIDPKTAISAFEIKEDIERVVCCPGTLLWSAHAPSIARTAMMKLGRAPVYQEITIRNVNTTRKILELMRRM
jgi:uncharacterized protein (DUF1697 family)